MAKVTPRTLSGFMELPPAQQMKMERMMQILRESYALYGFTPLDTPVIESAEVLLAKGGGETEKQIYRFQKGDSDLALRFDLTVPLAKYVAAHYAELSFPFRRYQIGKVYRGERAQRGRFREFYQADIDVIGDGKLDILNEAEIPAVIYSTFTKLGLTKFRIRVNNRKLLNGFYRMNGMQEKAGDIMRTVDKLDKIGPEKVKLLLIDEVKMLPCKAENVLDFMAIRGTNAEVLEALERYRGMDEIFDQGLDELNTVAKYLTDFGVPEENFAVDLTIAHGLRDRDDRAPRDRLRLLRRARRRPGPVLHRQAAARRGHFHRPDQTVLRAGRAGAAQRRDRHRALRRAGAADDGGAGLCRLRRHRPAARGCAHAALRRVEEVQGQDELRRQNRRALRGLHRRG